MENVEYKESITRKKDEAFSFLEPLLPEQGGDLVDSIRKLMVEYNK